MAEENADVIREMLKAFSRGDVDGVLAGFDPRCELHEPPEMVETAGYHGHDGIRAWMANLRQVGGIVFEPVHFSGSRDIVVCEVAGRGRAGQRSALRLVDLGGVRDARRPHRPSPGLLGAGGGAEGRRINRRASPAATRRGCFVGVKAQGWFTDGRFLWP